ncbi:NYN domain-containing protein [Arthrobacter psychrolactophilus]
MDNSAAPERNVAVFLDLENMYGGHHNGVTGVPLGRVVREIERIVRNSGLGRRTATIRAYANWGHLGMTSYKAEILEYGIKPVQIFSFDRNVKNAADIELCVDVLQVVHESPWIEVFVIVTGDGGFVPLIRRLHGLNKYVVVASTNAATAGIVNPLLKSVADEYHQIDVGPESRVIAVKVKLAPVVIKAVPSVRPARSAP